MTEKISDYSTTPASNNAATPNGWPEGQLPSTLNDCNREFAARVREWYEDAEWIDFGHTIVSSTSGSIKVSGDKTGVYTVGRAIRVNQSASQDGWVTASAYSAPDTSITVSGFTVSGPTQVEVGIIKDATSLPTNLAVKAALADGSTATTQTASDNSTKVATTAYVSTQISTDRKIVGRAYTTYGTYARITTVTPLDDTIPTNSEGDEVMSQAYTCAATTNRLRHTVTICGEVWTSSAAIASVFSGSTCIAAQITHGPNAAYGMGSRTFVFETVPGSTSSITYSVRVGVYNPGFFDINGYGGARVFGGVQVCSYVIEEIQP